MTEEAAVRFELVDINEILKTLPHRFPMLLIDRVVKIRTDYSGIGIRTGYLENEDKIKALANHLSDGQPPFVVCTPIEAARQMAEMIP